MALKLYHLNPDSEKIGICRATGSGTCPFSADNPHFATKEETQAYYENELESEYGLFSGASDSSKAMSEAAVRRRLNLLSDEALDQLIEDRFRFGGYTPREAKAAVAKGAPFYVNYTANQEMTLDPDHRYTQHTFMRGACAVFAAQVHRATGWPMVVYSNDKTVDYWQGHVAVRTPDGRYLDASGVSDDPTREFGELSRGWVRTEAANVEELHQQTANSTDGRLEEKEGLQLLERFAAAKIAFEVLKSEGLLEA